MSKGASPRWFSIAYALSKPIAILFGLAVVAVAVMAPLSSVLDSPAIRLAIGGIVGLALSLGVARLIPAKEKRSEISSDVLAVGWLAIALIVPWLAPSLYVAEAERLEESGHSGWAATVRWVSQVPSRYTDTDATRSAGAADPQAADPARGTKAPDSADQPPKDDSVDGDVADPTQTYSPAEIFRMYAPSVVSVQVKTSRGDGGGTGFLIDTAGVVVTNHHVVKDATAVSVKLMDGTRIANLELLTSDEDLDLALLRLHTQAALKPVLLGRSEDIEVGEPVVSIGNPLGLEHTLTDGVVSARRIWQGRKVIQMSAPVSPGNSGGPVFDRHAQVVGITFAKINPLIGENLNMAVPVDSLRPMLKSDYPNARKFGQSSW